jgi:hypothetical protein
VSSLERLGEAGWLPDVRSEESIPGHARRRLQLDDFLDRRLLSYFYHQNAWGYGKKVKKQSQLVTEPSGGSLERAVNRYSRQKRAYENHMKTWRANASYEFLFDPPDLKNYAIAS